MTPLSETRAAWLARLSLVMGVTAVYLPALLGGVFFLDVYLTEVEPTLAEIARALEEGTLAFWTRNIMVGYPLASNPQAGALYAPHLLLLALFEPDRAAVLSAWLHCILAALAVRALCRRAGASESGSVAGALLYAAAPFLCFYHQALHGLVVLSLLPLAVFLTWRGAETGARRDWTLGAVVLAAAMYAGHLQFVLYAGLICSVVALVVRPRASTVLLSAAQGGLALLLYAPQLAAAWDLWQESLRKGLSAADVTANLSVESLALDDLVESLAPHFFGGPSLNDFWYPEFLGAGALLCVVAALMGPRDRPTRMFGGLLAGGVIYLALVAVPGVGELILSIPGLSAFRAPGRVFIVILLSAAVLTARGVDVIADHKPVRVVGALLAVFGVMLTLGLGHDPWDGALVLAGSVPFLIPRCKAPVLALAVVLPVLWVGVGYLPVVEAVETPPTVELLRRVSPRRVLGVSAGDPNYQAAVPGPNGWPDGAAGDPARAGWSLVSNVGMRYGLMNFHGQTSLPLKRFIRRFFGALDPLDYPFQSHPSYDPRLLARAGVTHVVAPRHGQMPVNPRPRAVGEEAGYAIYAIADPWPAAFLVTSSGVRPVEILDESRGFAEVRVVSDKPGLLVYNEAWYPGWLANIDGVLRETGPQDGFFIGVPMEAGEHRVTFSFIPMGHWKGVAPAIVGLLLTLLGLLWPSNRRRSAVISNRDVTTAI